ncbi:MAG: YcbK family protein [Alphaproteobacteria bacterium]
MFNEVNKITRREFLGKALMLSAGVYVATRPKLVFAATHETRSLKLLNTHTGERANVVFWENGSHIYEALNEINTIFRDHRTGDVAHIDLHLLDRLYEIQQRTGNHSEYRIVSGYRSPATNKMLMKKSSRVAKKSMHTRGKAVDITLSGTSTKNLRKAALSLKSGGVGYYPSSKFVHLDTGATRNWRG